MKLDIDVRLDYDLDGPTDILLQVEAASLADQTLERSDLDPGASDHLHRVTSDEAVGERLWLRCTDRFTCTYSARVNVTRPAPALEGLGQVPLHALPGATVKYLMASRYCPSDQVQAFAAETFGTSTGGERVLAIRNWVRDNIAYVPGSSDASTTAADTLRARQGICRDFAHVVACLVRASAMPARVAAVYSPDIDPQDFHAVAEVYLDGAWYPVDGTGMASPDSMAMVGVGRDAADIAFMTLWGRATLRDQVVQVSRA